jgi:cytochrome d ubiquinol oxidase subunit II
MIDLNTTWYLLFGVLIVGYAILDGFDLGVGVLHLFTSDETEKRINLNAIGPVWDRNEVWLLTAGGALFAAFPPVYATVFSGFYIALMLLLTALIFRAVSLEFRGKVESSTWRKTWDVAFGIGSLLPAVLFGVAVGNILRGVPINADGMFTGSFFGLLNPYSIVVGVFSLVMFTLHGSLYMAIKADGVQQARMVRFSSVLWMLLVVLYILLTGYTFFEAAYLFDGVLSNPLSWLFFILLLAALVYLPLAVKGQQYFRAFLASSLSILCFIGLPAVSMFPRLVPSLTNLDYSLTIYNSSSTHLTLQAMLVIALIGMPVVIGYNWYIYRKFAGKTILSADSY